MKIWKIALYVVAIVVFASCGTYTQAPKNTIKVLAVTISFAAILLAKDALATLNDPAAGVIAIIVVVEL